MKKGPDTALDGETLLSPMFVTMSTPGAQVEVGVRPREVGSGALVIELRVATTACPKERAIGATLTEPGQPRSWTRGLVCWKQWPYPRAHPGQI